MSTKTDALINQLKALSDRHRLRVLALCQHGEVSVSELTAVLGQSQPRVSQHVKRLCDAGLLRRFRDGKRVYYRLPATVGSEQRRLTGLVPTAESPFVEDMLRLRKLRGAEILAQTGAAVTVDDPQRRAIYRALLDQADATPIGDLLDVGCGRGEILKLMANRANRAIGVDIDADARGLARAELLLAGLNNCSLRQGDMYQLPFPDQSFDTIVLDDVLPTADRPVDALREASRLLRPGGRLLLLLGLEAGSANKAQSALAGWCAEARLRLAVPRIVPQRAPSWLLSVATPPDARAAASAAA